MNNFFDTGLGLRQEFIEQLIAYPNKPNNFIEISPENSIKNGGKRLKLFEQYIKLYPVISHGLSLSIGG
ncbi:MAG: hypothetical protein ACJA0H_002332 [Francisellaceae bacterium]|jgi:uncharacterized protein (UPF0276 family)